MERADLIQALRDLPITLHPAKARCWGEITGGPALENAKDYQRRFMEAHAAYQTYSDGIGAAGYVPLRDVMEAPSLRFAFEEGVKPGKGWRNLKESQLRADGKKVEIFMPTVSEAGMKIRRVINDLPRWPGSSGAMTDINAVQQISYFTEGFADGNGITETVGISIRTRRIVFASYAWTGDRYFVSWPNHFFTMWELMEHGGATRIQGDEALMAWRPVDVNPITEDELREVARNTKK